MAGVDESAQRLQLRLHGVSLQLQVPADDDCMFELECDEPALNEWHARLATYAFEQEGLTLPMFLDKAVAVYAKLFPNATPTASAAPAAASFSSSLSSSSAAPAAAAAASASAQPASAAVDGSSMDDIESASDGFGDSAGGGGDAMEEDDDGFGGEEDAADWGDFKEAHADSEVQDTAWEKTKALKKRLMARAESDRVAASHASDQQRKGRDGIKTIFSSEAAVTMLVNDCMSFMSSTDPSLRVAPVSESVFQWSVKLSKFDPESKIEEGLQQLKATYGYEHVELELKFMADLYPFFPPSVRLVRPRLKNFMIGRLVCQFDEVQQRPRVYDDLHV